jgi:alanine dehydrogenase
MKPRSVIIDASIDQGGCVETSRPTTHDDPIFIEENIVHYCVPNIPSVVARTASHVFVNSAIPYIFEIANHGIEAALKGNVAIEAAVNTHQGKLINLVRMGV